MSGIRKIKEIKESVVDEIIDYKTVVIRSDGLIDLSILFGLNH